MRRQLKGFTLAEVAVAAALVAILAAAAVPTLAEYLDQRDVETTAKTLSAIAAGIVSYQTSVRTTGTNATYPGKISYLTNVISTTDLNSCGAAYTGATSLVSTYSAAAPFVSFYIPPGGLQTPLGTIQDAVTRTPNSNTVGRIEIVMPSVDSLDATRLERYIDGDDGTIAANKTAGIFRINASTFPRVNVSYVVPVGARC